MRFSWFLIGIIILALAGCGSRCDAPYKLIGDICCIDDDNSGVCDLHEFEAKMAEKPAPVEKPAAEPTVAVATKAEEPEPAQVEPQTVNQDKLPERITSLVPSIEPEKDYEPEYVIDRPQEVDFELTNFKYGYGRAREMDVKIKNNLDFEVSPRIYVYAIQDGEYKRVAEMLYKSLSPGRTRTVEQDSINAEIDDENKEVTFELLYHSTRTGLAKVGEIRLPLE